MPSLNLDLNYFDHVKTIRLVARLGPGSDVLPIRLWAWVGSHQPETGYLALLEAELEHVCRWWGEKGAMVSAMMEIGFIKKRGAIYEVNDWLDHSGHLAAFKKRAQKAARKRWGIKRKSSNATSIAKHKPKQSPSRAVHSRALPTNNTEGAKAPASKVFSKPSHVEVQVYAQEIGFLKFDAEAWVDHYEANGWRVGRTPMKDWKAAVRQWKRRANEFGASREAAPAPPLGRYVEHKPREEDIFDPNKKMEAV